MRKSLQLQADMTQEFGTCVFDVTLDCEDGAPVGGEAEHAALVTELALATQAARADARIAVRVHPVDHPSFEADISHIAGSTTHLMAIAQQAYDLDLEGLMIETHVDPANALSDSDQQVDPDTLFRIVNGLTQRVRSFDQTNAIDQVGELRSRIDKLDLQLLDILVRRVELIGELGDLKRANNVSVLQLERWKEIIDNCMAIARANGLNEEFVRNVFLQIHDEAIRLQSKMLQEFAEKGNQDS